MTRIVCVVAVLLLCVTLPTGAQSPKNEQVPAQGFGPVAVTAGETLQVCVGNVGEGNSRSTVQVFSLTGDSVKFVTKYDPNLAGGKSACYNYAPKSGTVQLFAVLAGDPTAGWDISDRALMASAQVLDGGGKARVVLTPLPKIVSTKLLQK